MMINYNDPDYVHWGYLQHYTTGISVIDDGVRQLTAFVDADPAYRDGLLDYFRRACLRGGQTPHLLEEAFAWHVNFRDHGTMQPATHTAANEALAA